MYYHTKIKELESRGLKLLKDLISIPSVSPEGEKYQELVGVLKDFFDEMSVGTEVIKVPLEYQRKRCPETGDNPRFILRAYNKGDGPWLQFNGHYDVVPGGPGWSKTEPFKPQVEGNIVYGRGATDMKGGLVSMAMALASLTGSPYNVDAVFVPDEEIGGACGTGYYISTLEDRKPDYAIIAEPSTLEHIWIGHKGGIWMKVVVEGKTAHASTPWMGRNSFIAASKLALAIEEKMKSILSSRLSSHEYDFPQSKKPTIMIGGEAGVLNGKSNQVPGKTFFTIDRRLIVEESVENAEKELRETILDLSLDLGLSQYKISLKTITKMSPVIVEPGNPLSKAIIKASSLLSMKPPKEIVCTGGLDLRYYIESGIMGVAYGPGARGVEHAPDEYVDYRSVVKVAQIYSIVPTLLNSNNSP